MTVQGLTKFFGRNSTIATKKFRPLFSCHFTKIGCSLTFIVIMIDVGGMTVVDEIFCPANKFWDTKFAVIWKNEM
jgi:hypothetical protein